MRREVHRHRGRATRRFACALLGASLAMVVALVVAVAVDVAGASPALAAGAGREPLHGRQGIVPPGATLIGPAPSTTTLPLVVTLQPRDPAALSAEVQAVSDPRAPEYRHFLTPAEFARRFGPTPSTVAQVASALRSQGLTVGPPSATGLSLPVSGTVAEVQSAFSTPISRYRLSSGKTGYDNRSAPEVPVTVAPQIEGIIGLDTLSPPQPSTTLPQASSASPHPATSAAAPTVSGQPTPTCSGLSGAQSSFPGALDADQLAQAYSFDPLYAANHYGAGATVALVEMAGAGYSPSDISTFAACYGITGGGQITQKDVDGGGAEGPATVESELDIENVLSLAPQANIEVYEGEQSMYDVFSQIVSDHTAKIVSASWTNGCEAYVGQSTQQSESALFQEAAIDGQSIFVASGDEGSE
ncbi:MAG TPA: protease pro-enzyme activation domain-containing protein, partial [Acidimicrobiales bacterium]|nr:protease pro-enzyme activation domain-containing protein [Acidimicrobiales bacterium]